MCDHSKGTSHTYDNSYKVVFPSSSNLSVDFYEKALRERELFLNELILSNRCNGITDSTPGNQAGFLSSSAHYNSTNSRKSAAIDEKETKAALPPMKMEILEYFNTVVIPEALAKQKAKADKLKTNPSADFDHLLNETEELPDEFSQFMHEEHVNDYYRSYEEEMYIEDGSPFKIQEKSKTRKNMHLHEELTRSLNTGKHPGHLQYGVYYSKPCTTTMSSFHSNVQKSNVSSRVVNRLSLEKGNRKSKASGSNNHAKRNKSNDYSGFEEETAWENRVPFTGNSICSSSPDLGVTNEDDIVIIDDSYSSMCSNATSHIDDRSPDETFELLNDDPAIIDFIKNMDDSEFHGIVESESKISADNDENDTNKVNSIGKTTAEETNAGSVISSIDYTTIDDMASYCHNEDVECIGEGNAVNYNSVNDEHNIITTTGVANTRDSEQENKREFLTATVNSGASMQMETNVDNIDDTLNNINDNEAIARKIVEDDFLIKLDDIETDPEVAIAKPNEDVAIAMDYIICDDKDSVPKSTDDYPLVRKNKDVIFRSISVAQVKHGEHENELAIVANPLESLLKMTDTVNDVAMVSENALILFDADGNETGANKMHGFEVESRIEDSGNVMDIAVTNMNLIKENVKVIEDDISLDSEHNEKMNVIKTINDNALETCYKSIAAATKPDDNFEKMPSFESVGNDSGSQIKSEDHLASESNICNETTIGEISIIEKIPSNDSLTNFKNLSVSRLGAYKSISVNAGMQWMSLFNAYVNIIRNCNRSISITTISCFPKVDRTTLCMPLYHKLKTQADTMFIYNNAVYKVMEYLSSIVTQEVHIPNRAQITEVAENTDIMETETEIVLSHSRPAVCRTNYLKDSIDVVYEDTSCKVCKEDDDDCKENMGGSLIDQNYGKNIFEKDEFAINCLHGLLSHKTISDVVNGNSIAEKNFEDNAVCDYSDLSISNSRTTINQDIEQKITNSKYAADNSALDKVDEESSQEFDNNSQDNVEVPSENTSNHLEYSCSESFNSEGMKESNSYSSAQGQISVALSSVTEKAMQSKEIDGTSTSQFDDINEMSENVISHPQEMPFEIGMFDIFFSESDCSDEKMPSLEYASIPSAEVKSNFLEKLHNMKFDNVREPSCQTVDSDTAVALLETEKSNADKINLAHSMKKQRTLTSIQKKEKIDLNDPFSFLSVKVESAHLHRKVINENKDSFRGTEVLDENAIKVVSEGCVLITDNAQKKQFIPEQIIPVVFSGELLEIAHEMETFAIPIVQKLLITNKFGLSLSLTLDRLTSELTHFFLNQELKFCQDNGVDSWQGVAESCYCQLLLLHGVIRALEVLIHVDLSASVQCLKEYQMAHHAILGGCYQHLLNKMSQTHVKLCYENAVHPKIERTSAFLIDVFNQSKACYIEYKVLLIVRRSLRTIFQSLKSSLNEIQSDVDVIHIQESVHLENFSQIIENKANCIFVANALSLSQNIDCSLLTLIMECESREDFSFWKNICQSFKIAYSSLQVPNLNFKTLQEIRDLTAFETDLHEKIQETQSEVMVFASEMVTSNGDLLKLLETKGNITVIGRDYEQWLPDLFFPDIGVNSDVAVLLVMLLDLQDGKFVDNLLNKIFSFHLKYETCWVIFRDKMEKRYNCLSRSKIESSLWHVHGLSNIITSRFEHYKIKFLFVENNDQLLGCVESIMKKAHHDPEKKKEALLQTLFNYDITQDEVFLMAFPCINSFRAQVMLSSSAIYKLLAMDIEELTFHFPTFPIHVLEMFHSMTHATVFGQASPVIENPPTCHNFNLDTSNEFFPVMDDFMESLTDCSNDIPSSPEPEVYFDNPHSLSLEEIDRNYVSLKSEQDMDEYLPYKQQSHSKHCMKESPHKFHRKMHSNILKSPYKMHSNLLELPHKMHSSVEESPYKLRDRVNELPHKLNSEVRVSSYKLYYDMRESSYKPYYSSDNYERDSSFMQDGNFCHQMKESSDRNFFHKQNGNSYCHVKESSDRNSAYIAKKPFYKLHGDSKHCMKKESLSDIETCEIAGYEKQHSFDSMPYDFAEYSKTETKYMPLCSTKYGECSKGAAFTRDAPIENIDAENSNVVLQKRSFPKHAFEGKQRYEQSSLFPDINRINHSVYFQPRYKLYSPDNESDFCLKSENLSNAKDFAEHRSSLFEQRPYITQDRSENPRSRFAASKFEDAELDREQFGFSKTLQRPGTSRHRHAVMPETQRHSIASHCFGKNSVDALKLRDVKPDPSSKIGIVSPMVQVSPDIESPPMDLDGSTIPSLYVKSGKKKEAFNNCESTKAENTRSPIRKRRKLTYERARGQKGQTKLIFK